MPDPLSLLAMEIRKCRSCPLHKGRRNAVPGAGPQTADILFLGEAPGEEEDKKGKPFVGRAGRFLGQLVSKKLQLPYERLFVTNKVRCLKGSTQVYLGDGSRRNIRSLVVSRYNGTVLSLHGGAIVPRRVTGWHRAPIAGRRLFRVSHVLAKDSRHRTSCGMVATEDHEVWTDTGWVPVRELEGRQVCTGLPGLTEYQYQLMLATKISDGHISRWGTQARFHNNRDQLPYLAAKRELLAKLLPTEIKRTSHAWEEYTFSLPALRAILPFRDLTPSDCVSLMSDFGVACWYMNDGYLSERPHRRPLAEIATTRFDVETVDKLTHLLNEKGFGAYRRDTSIGPRIVFGADATEELARRTATFVVPALAYKLPAAFRGADDPTIWTSTTQPLLYAEARLEEVGPGPDRSVYCLDVAGSANFVTPAGVVHNCRPPNNRDPLPAELEACSVWTKKQLELIEPKLIVALGRFAAEPYFKGLPLKKIRGSLTRVDGHLVFASYHPAAGLHQPKLKRVLEKDFELLREVISCL